MPARNILPRGRGWAATAPIRRYRVSSSCREGRTTTTTRRQTTIPLAIGTLLVLAAHTPAAGAQTECLARFEVAGGTEDAGGITLACQDGDPSCDADATADGTCLIASRVCIGPAACATEPLSSLRVHGRAGAALADAVGALPALDPGSCTTSASVAVRAGRRRRVRVKARGDAGTRDRDRLRVVCQGAESARALVVTTDFETGLLARLRVLRPYRPKRIGTRIHSDAVLRVHGSDVFVVNRFLGDNVQILNATGGFGTRLQCSTGVGSNPHDLVVVAPDKAYVTRYDRTALWVVDPSSGGCAGFQRGSIDLGAVADADGLPEMDQMAVVGTRLFVTAQRLDRRKGFAPTGPSALVVIDTTTDQVEQVVDLQGQNAFGDASGLQRHPDGDLLLAQAGNVFRTGDGGIERVDPAALVSLGMVVTEDALGGSVTDFVLLSATKGYAVVIDESLRNSLVAFDPSTGAPATRVFASQQFIADVTTAPDGTVWLATRTGIRIFDPVTDQARGRPLDVGLPPFSIEFLR
jgi:hypothetical protein